MTQKRDQFFHLTTELVIILLVMALVIFTRTAGAEESEKSTKKTKKKQTVTTTVTTTVGEIEEDEDSIEDTDESSEETKSKDTGERVLTATFGSNKGTGLNGCKTADLAKNVINDLKGDCNAWLKDRKADLKAKFLTGSCQESCTDCGMGLTRCAVDGLVHYSTK